MLTFEWHKSSSKDTIDGFLDMLCKDHPKIAHCVAVRGFGDLQYWFGFGGSSYKTAECGCLIGNIALCAIEHHNLSERIEAALVQYNVYSELAHDGATIAYFALLLASDTPLPDKVVYTGGDSGNLYCPIRDNVEDPLFRLLYDIGLLVGAETDQDADEDETEFDGDREDKLKRFLRHSILTKLNDNATQIIF